MRRTFAIISLCFLSAVQSSASEKGQLGMVGVRHLGMGGTCVAIANDGNSLLENPTGLNRVSGWKATMPIMPLTMTPNLTLLLNGDPIRMMDAVVDIASNTDDDTIFERIDRIEEAAADHPYASVEGGIFPNFVMRNFGVGLLVSGVYGLSTEPVVSGGPEIYESLDMTTRGFIDAGGLFSYAHDLPWQPSLLGLEGKLTAGATLKMVWRGYMKSIEHIGELDEEEERKAALDESEPDEADQDLSWDGGFGLDLATRLDLNDSRSTVVSLVLHNLPTGIKYSYDDGTEMHIRASASLGVASRPLASVNGVEDLIVGFDIQRIGQGGAFHIGTEYSTGPAHLRMGVSDDGFAWGLGLKWRTVEIDYANFRTPNAWFGDDYIIRNHVLQASLNF